jgi:hypothetical protein
MSRITLIVHNPDNLPTVEYSVLRDLQGDLKTITKDNLEKLKESIMQYGFVFPFFVWIDDNNEYWIHDGHQRQKALQALERENVIIPKLPYARITADSKKEAAELLLMLNSRYGEFNPDTSFFDEFDIDFNIPFEIPELNFISDMPSEDELDEFFKDIEYEDKETEPKIITCPECGKKIEI